MTPDYILSATLKDKTKEHKGESEEIVGIALTTFTSMSHTNSYIGDYK